VASVQKHILGLENGLVRPNVVVVLSEMCPSLVAQSYSWSVMAGQFKSFLCDAFSYSLFNSLFHQLIIISLIIILSVYYRFFCAASFQEEKVNKNKAIVNSSLLIMIYLCPFYYASSPSFFWQIITQASATSSWFVFTTRCDVYCYTYALQQSLVQQCTLVHPQVDCTHYPIYIEKVYFQLKS
jgi:hypothetical protein